jgi:hypothetical protein
MPQLRKGDFVGYGTKCPAEARLKAVQTLRVKSRNSEKVKAPPK